MGQMRQRDYPIKWIPLRLLSVVWLDAQRPPNPKEEQRIADNFDPDALDPITVTLPNGKGIYHVIDGQTRVGALRRLWGDEDQKVPCRVLDTRSREEAAGIWLTMNEGHKKPHAVERFLVAVAANRADECAVDRIVEEAGFRVANHATDGVIAAVGALLRIYRKQGEAGLVWTLSTIRETWGDDRDAVHGGILQGYADLLAKHPEHDQKRLVAKVAKEYTPGRLLGAAKTAREMFKGTIPSNIVKILEQTYNNGMRNGPRLEP